MDFENQKMCVTCKEQKSLDCFTKCAKRADGLESRCRDCQSEYMKAWYLKNKEKVAAKQKAYYVNNRVACTAYNKRYAEAHPVKLRKQARERQRSYANLPTPARPCPIHCEMCLKPVWETCHALHLDHCHTTGEFRGWLCSSCNRGFGSLGDSFEEARKRLNRYEKTITNLGE